jgi:hypothetical protein
LTHTNTCGVIFLPDPLGWPTGWRDVLVVT